MNLNFTDVGAALINMGQQGLSNEVVFNPVNAGPQSQVFADKLDKTLKLVEPPKKDIPVNSLKEKVSIHQKEISKKVSEKIPEKISGKLNQTQGYGFVSELKTVFLALSKGNLKDISIDPEGLEILKKMLLKAGFGKNEVEDLMSELSDKLEQGTLTLDEVFNELFELPFEVEDVLVEETILEAGQAPFLESILVSLGIPQETIQEILSEADRGDNGISLDVVIDKLQNLQKKAFYSQTSFQVSKTDKNIQMLSQQIGLDLDNANLNSFSLNDVVRALESMRQHKTTQQNIVTDHSSYVSKDVGDEKSQDLLNALFKTLNIKNDNFEKQTVAISTDKIKEKFENPMLINPDETGTKSLFDMGKGKKILKSSGLKDGFKELEALTGRETKNTSIVKDPLTDAKIGVRKLTVAVEKNIDQSQVSLSDSKMSQTGQKTEIFKNQAPAPKPLPAYVTQQVSKSLVRAINQGENSLKIQLKPPELGRMLLTIQNSGSSLRVSIMTENHAAKEIISQNITELRTVLSNSGVNLEKIEVDMSNDFRQSMADTRQQSKHSGKRDRNQANKVSGGGSGEGLGEAGRNLNGLNQNGSVHLVA
ncbi:MAG: flagellar hook-length control protein FliK [Desulfobacula sp.]|nr:flagellar hook-length control protein FliK [Desulfobacula sp.]